MKYRKPTGGRYREKRRLDDLTETETREASLIVVAFASVDCGRRESRFAPIFFLYKKKPHLGLIQIVSDLTYVIVPIVTQLSNNIVI